jgi:hypothetical protein
MTTPTHSDCEREIEALHEFFVAWYTGTTDDFDRVEAALGARFEMIHPDGNRVSRAAILDSIRETNGSYDPGAFDIDIRAVEMVDSGDGYAVVRYEEWQTTPDEENGRLSTVVFNTDDDTPSGLSWVTVHETWLEN